MGDILRILEIIRLVKSRGRAASERSFVGEALDVAVELHDR